MIRTGGVALSDIPLDDEAVAGDEVHLSPREQEIVRLVAKGYPNKTIAGVLDISPWTVSTHLRRIFAKLGVNSRAEMVASALVTGLVDGAL
ncbi:MAG: helix-turn-helix transcriptional regulator [Caldilineaceae bacterium]